MLTEHDKETPQTCGHVGSSDKLKTSPLPQHLWSQELSGW